MKKLILFILFSLAVFSSCDPSKIYEKHINNERITWNRFDVKTFQVDIEDISATYDFYVAIRRLTDFPLPYLEIRFTIYAPSGEMRTMEQKIVLKDKQGNLLGDGMGDLWDLEHLAREGFQFTEPGTCIVEISSAMSQADLPGIMQVGLIVRKRR